MPNLITKHLTSSPYQLKENMGRTLWIWDTLPQKGIKSEDQTWINEGDAVENVHRLTIGNNYKTNNQGKFHPNRCYSLALTLTFSSTSKI